MKTSKVFQHADIDNIMLQAQNSLCGIIKEISDISRGAVDQHVFVVLCNDTLHKIPAVFLDSGILESTIGAKKVFLNGVVPHFKSLVQQDVELGAKIFGKYKELFDIGDFSTINNSTQLNEHISALQKAIEEYRVAAIQNLAKKQAELLGEQVAEEFNKVNVNNVRSTSIDLGACTDKIAELTAQLHVAEDIEAQKGINKAFLEKFKDANKDQNKSLELYLTDPAGDTTKDYKQDPEHLSALANLSFAEKIKDLSNDQEAKAKIMQRFVRTVLGRQKALREDTIPHIKKFIKLAAETQASDLLDKDVQILNKLLNRLTKNSLKEFAEAVKTDQTTVFFLKELGLQSVIDDPNSLTTTSTATSFPADIKVACKRRIDTAAEKTEELRLLITQAVNSYNTGITDTKKITPEMIALINDIPHAISEVLQPLYQSTTGSSRFF
ncbi:MAG: hypothetical protein ABSA84_00710 [Gammaproteobacteria bacterium]